MNNLSDYSNFKVGIFDSGRGGEYVALEMAQRFKNLKILSLNDPKNIPYGAKTPDQMFKCISPFMQRFEDEQVDAIVIACNTCYINLEAKLKQLTGIPIIGYLPALEEAASKSQTKAIMTCATAGTLKSDYWQELKRKYVSNFNLIDVDCTHWVSLVEQSKVDESQFQAVINQAVNNKVDSLILGCTHYHWLKKDLQALIPQDYNLEFYEPSLTVFSQLDKLLACI